MNETVFRLAADDIHQLARQLTMVLGIPLYLHCSPMIGEWYSNGDAWSIGTDKPQVGLSLDDVSLQEADGEAYTSTIPACSCETGQHYYVLRVDSKCRATLGTRLWSWVSQRFSSTTDTPPPRRDQHGFTQNTKRILEIETKLRRHFVCVLCNLHPSNPHPSNPNPTRNNNHRYW